MEDLWTLLLRGLKFIGKALLVLLDITNVREGLRTLWQTVARPGSEEAEDPR